MPSDPELQHAYARLVERKTPGARRGCVPPEAILAVVERSGDEATRLGTLDHVMACPDCRKELDLLRALAEILPRKEPATGGPSRFMPGRFAWAATLALAVGAGSLWWGVLRPGPEPVMRGRGEEIRLVSPEAGARLREGVTFTWRSPAESFEYTLEIFDGEGRVLLSTSTRDTTYTLRGPLPRPEEGDLRWWVTARMGNGARIGSEMRPLEPSPY